MHVLLGPLLGAAAVAAMQALAAAYLTALLVGAFLLGAAPVLVATLLVPPRRVGHWMGRPTAQGVILAVGTVAAIALTARLLGDGGEVYFVRPLLPGIAAAFIDAGLLVGLGVRGARRGREEVRGADVRGGARSLGRLAARALCRAVAVVVLAGATIVFLGCASLAVDHGAAAEVDVGALMLGVLGAFLVGGLGSLFAWWGRRAVPARA